MPRRLSKKLSLTLAIFLALSGLLSIKVHRVNAAGSADLNIYYDEVHPVTHRVINGTNVVLQLVIDNDGPDSVTSVTLDTQFTNLQYSSSSNSCSGATNPGTFDFNTGVWAGQIDSGQLTCFNIFLTVTGSAGQTASLDVDIVSSLVLGGDTNIDPNSANNSISDSLTIQDADDMALSSRIVTAAPITSGTPVMYEVTMSNIGNGRTPSSDDTIYLYVLLPEQASYSSFSDPNAGDGKGFESCSVLGTGVDLGYVGNTGQALLCVISTEDNIFESGDSYAMNINMTASADFISGTSFIGGILFTPAFEYDPDYPEFSAQIGLGTPAMDININNASKIIYDASALTSTITRCSGQANPTSEDNACFDVVFNKPIYATSFTVDDLVMYGGNVYEFSQQSPTSWRVRLNSLPLDQTFSLSLASSSVTDLSAVLFSGQVLGDNTILYSSQSSASVGLMNAAELAKTGLFVGLATPLGLFLILGAAYTYYDYRKHLAPLYEIDKNVKYTYLHHLSVVTVPEIRYRIKTEISPFRVKKSEKVRHF